MTKTIIIGIIGFLFFVGIMMGIMSSSKASDSVASNEQSTSAKDETSKSSVAKTETLADGTILEHIDKNDDRVVKLTFTDGKQIVGGTSSNVFLSIVHTEETNVIGNRVINEKAHGKFMVVSVVVMNEQNDAVTVDASSYQLLDKNGREYSANTGAGLALKSDNRDANVETGFLKKINPGTSATFVFAYDVPENLRIEDVKMKARGGMLGKPIILPFNEIYPGKRFYTN